MDKLNPKAYKDTPSGEVCHIAKIKKKNHCVVLRKYIFAMWEFLTPRINRLSMEVMQYDELF